MILALNGSGLCGKDTGCRVIQELLYPRHVVRDAFADRLKLSLSESVGLPRETMEALKNTGSIDIKDGFGNVIHTLTVRHFMERYGTEAHRDVFHDDFWISHVLLAHLARLKEIPTGVTVITDLRFPNEAEAVHEMGGFVWEIVRPGSSLESDHPSNQPLPRNLLDHTIRNDTTLGAFRHLLRQELQRLPGVGPLGGAT